ncbi:unnamed protein product [Paramecium octaurelia]|uniref:Uncharacterized protein n=1 Tax=Paramecium octaurelia TaxID=43137 RepID=A0A8S1VCN5_PAROT|nr:unnamed protein product [Paramecium octaurelia]
MFHEFLQELGTLKNAELPFPFRNQFKIKENFINPNSKHFESIAQKLLSEEKAGIKRKWDKQCKMMFIWILGKFFQLKNKKTINPNQEEWIQLASILQIDETTLKQRWITLINPVSKSINWDPEEDEIIKSLMHEQDEKHIWTHIALELYNQNNGQFIRTPKQVRERWMNYLNPKLKKTNWSQQEDLQLLNTVVKNGKRWSLISTLLEGRTENQVKNRFKSLIQKIHKDEEEDDIEELQAIKEYLNKQNIEEEQEPQKEEPQIRTQYSRQAKLKFNLRDKSKDKIQEAPPILPQETQTKRRKISSQIKDFLNIGHDPVVQQQQKVQQVQKTKLKENKQQQQQQQQQKQSQQQQQQQKQQQEQLINKQNDEQLLDQSSFQLDQQQKIVSQQYQIPQLSLNESNKRDLSTPNTLSYYFQPQLQQMEELKNDQFRLKQVQMSPIQQQQQQNQVHYQGFRPFQEEIPQQIQQTPVQMLMGQYFKNYPSNYNMISPFQQINQTPMVYTPAQPMYMYNNNNNAYMGMSPLLIRSPYQEMSPSVQPQQTPQMQQNMWQTPLQTPLDQMQSEQQKQQQFNTNLEFLKSNNLLNSWIKKRTNEKQNQTFYDSLQSLDQ